MSPKKPRNGHNRSFLWDITNRLTAIIYSFFVHGRVGEMLSSREAICKRSGLSSAYEKRRVKIANAFLKYPELFLEKSRVVRAFAFIGRFLAALKLNVYGIFFVFYGLSSFLVYLIPALVGGFSALDEMSVISSQIILIAAMPLLFSSQSAMEGLSSSVAMKRVLLENLCIPEERLKSKKQYGGAVYMFSASVMAILLGLSSAFTHVLFVPIVILCLIAMIATFSFPEIGVIATLCAVPFMKYFNDPEMMLLAVVVTTAIAYICKVFQRKRTFKLSPEISIVLLFCGFILTGGMFSYGGAETFKDSVISVVIILGGFLTVYNLISTEKLLSSCLKSVTASYLILCLIGIWEGVYYGLSARIIDSVGPDISGITGENIFYLTDNGTVFGMFAVFVLPLLFAYISKRKSVQGAAAVTVLCILLMSAAWMCSYYEIIVALMIECIMFWFIFSHRTMTVVIFAAIPIGIVAMIYPLAVFGLGIPNVSELLMEYMPAVMVDAERHMSVVTDVMQMLGNGNLIGIGAGDHAFRAVFPAYASDASFGAAHPMSFWLQLICWSGIFGATAFLIFAVFLVKKSLGFFIRSPKNELRSKALALFCAISAALLLGSVYSIWEDMRVMYLFWTFSGLLMGHIRIGDFQETVRRSKFIDSTDAADVELVFYD